MAKVDEDKIWIGGSLFVVIDSNLREPKGSCNKQILFWNIQIQQNVHLSHLYNFFVSEGSTYLSDYWNLKKILSLSRWLFEKSHSETIESDVYGLPPSF